MIVGIEELKKKMLSYLKDKTIVDHEGRQLYGKIVVFQMSGGKFIHGEMPNHVIEVSETFRE